MEDVLAVWLASMALGALGLPLAVSLLRRFPDAGAGLAIPIGLLAVSLPYFLLRVATVLPPGRGGYLIAFALAAIISLVVARQLRLGRSELVRVGYGALVAASVYSGAFLAYVAFRSFNAEIAGTEQPMDFLFLNATLTSPSYPPHDPWLAGEPISYYYFGFLQVGVLTSIAGIPASVGYNLGLAYTFAATAAGIVSVAWALARWALPAAGRRFVVVAPAVALVLVLFVGSLSAIFEWAAAHERYHEGLYRAFGVENLLPCEPGQTGACYAGAPNLRTTAWYPTEFWFWWRGSRVIPETITEFPFFSFLLGDLHPHVMALPLVTLAVGLAAATWRGRGRLGLRRLRARPWEALALAAVFGGLAFQNAWDVITFSGLLGLAAVARNWREVPFAPAVAGAAAWLLPIAIVAALLYAPWWLTFDTQARGLYAYAEAGTIPAHAFLQFGVPVFLAALALITFAPRARGLVSAAVAAGWVAVLPFVGWVALAALRGDLARAVDERGLGGWVTMAVYGLLTWGLAALAVSLAARRHAAAPVAALGTVGVLLLYGAELFLVRDVFFGSVPRLNTVFKLSYQAWLMLGLAGSIALAATLAAAWRRAGPAPRWLVPAARAAALPAACLLVAGLVYPLLAAFNRTEGFTGPTTIDGLAWLRTADPHEYALTRWVAANTPPGAVIIEATGRRWVVDADGNHRMVDANVSYTDAGRIASRTGRQTPVGWFFHQIQWRGDTEANRTRLLQRQDAVDEAYLTASPGRVVSVMREFGADYLVVGKVELDRYPGPFPDYDAFLDRVFEAGPYRVYRLPHFELVSAP
jgi:YYY domain-containing protein